MSDVQVLSEFKQYIHSTDEFLDLNRIRFKFPNGFGASVVRGEHTYGGSEGLFELGVLIFTDGQADDDGETYGLHYQNSVARGDVVGYLTIEDVSKYMLEIMAFVPEWG